ncbi:EAL domain-containing protein [Psychrosphaera sp. F3M07]|uniref:bifunctional diguanylate cyclase/phosphodiesterase n=1 Tax=Psychrosphaera sp. F3M07 TaxID=2841560 RepID=UPI001C09298C|nr:EAL domain-containing protein [Psychrosphaera sp. F3M07]
MKKQKYYKNPKKKFTLSIVFASFLIFSFLAFFEYSKFTHDRQEQVVMVTRALSDFRARLEFLINENLKLPQGLITYASLNPDLTQQQFELFARETLISDNRIRNIALAKDLVISHMYPMAGNEKAIGLDYKKNLEQKLAAIQSVNLNKIIVAGPLNLVQGGVGLIARQPIFVSSTGELWGIASIVLDYKSILSDSGITSQNHLRIGLRGKNASGTNGEIFFGDLGIFDTSPAQLDINLPYGSWRIAAEPIEGWLTYSITIVVWSLALVIFMITFLILRQKQNIELLHRDAIKKLLESEQRFRTFFKDHDSVMFLIEQTSGKIIDANDSAIEFYGYSHQQLRKKRIQDLSGFPMDKAESEHARSLDIEQKFSVFPHKLADGTIRQVEVHTSPMMVDDTPILFSIIHDITKRVEIEKKLQLDAKVFENSQEGVLITDPNQIIIAVNHGFTAITGYEEADSIGKTPAILSSNRHGPEFFAEMFSQVDTLGFWRGEIWNRRKNGDVYPELLSISKVEDEYGELINYVGVFSDITRLKQSEQRLERLAHYDALTGLPNRLMLKSRLKHAIGLAKRQESKLAVLFIDLDKFKIVNDSLGHVAGDELLKQVANRMSDRMRQSDTVSRIGGDEFVLLVEGVAHLDDLILVAQDIINDINKPFMLSGENEVFIGTSIGISIFPNDAKDAENLVTFADAAMYRAKQNGRNTYSFYTESLLQQADVKLKLSVQLKHAIEQNELELFYQPQVDLLTGALTGVEALIRWNHPEKGLLAASEFIELAEERGIIHDISKWVLEQGCKQLKVWQGRGFTGCLSLNISPRDFGFGDFFNDIKQQIEKSGIDPKGLELEITENAIMKRADAIMDLFKQLKELGVSIAIDDFGTGYSSLSYLKHFPIDKLKIDQAFVKEMHTDLSDSALIETIINMARGFNLTVIAEGIELSEHASLLIELGCDQGQGYLYARPLPLGDVEALSKTNHWALD